MRKNALPIAAFLVVLVIGGFFLVQKKMALNACLSPDYPEEERMSSCQDAMDAIASEKDEKALALLQRGRIHEVNGRTEQALEDFNRAVGLVPESPMALTFRGAAYAAMGAHDLALADFDAAVTLAPNDPNAMNSKAWTLATASSPSVRNGGEAVRYAESAVALQRNNYAFSDTLAAAYAEAGRFEDAVREQERALRLLGERPHPDLEAEFKRRLALYQQKQPYRQ